MKFSIVLLASLLTFAPLPSFAQIASSTFDSGTESWVIRDISTFGNPPAVNQTWSANYQSTGGNPGGMIWAPDVSSGPVTLFQAPTAFLGNKLAAYGGSFVFDMQISNWNVTNKPGLILVGSGMTLYYTMSISGSGWSRYQVPLFETSSWHLNSDTGAAPSSSQFQSVLSNLSAIYINPEWDWVNTNEVGNMDNVAMFGSTQNSLVIKVKLMNWSSPRLPAVSVAIDNGAEVPYLLTSTGIGQGQVTINIGTAGTHRVWVKPTGFLAQARDIDYALGNQNVNYFGPDNSTGMIGGDINDDNVIDLGDFDMLSSGFGQEGDQP